MYRDGVIEVVRGVLEWPETEAVLVALEMLKVLFEHGQLCVSKYGNLFVVHFQALKGKLVLEKLVGSMNIEVHNCATNLLKEHFIEN